MGQRWTAPLALVALLAGLWVYYQATEAPQAVTEAPPIPLPQAPGAATPEPDEPPPTDLAAYRRWDDQGLECTAADLVRCFAANEVAAADAARGQLLTVHGTVSSVAEGPAGGLYLILDAQVTCGMRPQDRAAVAQVRPGETRTVIGYLAGGGGLGVTLRECSPGW